ncbi:MAG TPA: membrane dipeptidase [Bryobacteraceae bacterium]|nr:membrane dipeptidase [Bryobacteraceae bacterium]HOL70348.1 membrane dipeptidase [Bryobacteraceae bacterium]HOQ47181.1 membrane dipeptidase [Bryobacteraceae bacterium]HPQ15159.1 membrane dipeptidase [Bryobacteraceae bacterium]HPU72548.1 membrane dipeptidase [Bryobacteraceae bacterium]
MLNRRNFLKQAAIAGGALLAAPMVNRGHYALFGGTRRYSKRTIELIEESVVMDMLGLLTLDWPKLSRWVNLPGAFNEAEYRKLLSSGITVFHPAVDLNVSEPEQAFVATRDWFQSWNEFLSNYPQQLIRIDSTEDVLRAKRERRIGVILGFQNAAHFRTVDDVCTFYQMGQRISQLTYNEPNRIGTGCVSQRDTGLTEYGAQVIRAMNETGMAVDLSHSSDCTCEDAIEVSRKPVLITHANCKALNPGHPRCKPDRIIRKMAATGGVMGITSIRRFVRGQEPTTIEDVLDHFDHVAKLVGVEHLGLGSDNDLDGRDRKGTRRRMDVSGLNHPQRVYDLTEGLIRRRYTNRSIRMILGGSFLRALREIWG